MAHFYTKSLILLTLFFTTYILVSENKSLINLKKLKQEILDSKNIPDLETSQSQTPLIHHQTAVTCQNSKRRLWYKNKCRRNPKQKSTEKLRNILVDYDQQIMACLVPKAGTKSWIRFIVKSKISGKYPNLEVRNDQFLAKYGLQMINAINIHEFNEKYGNWSKYMVVRHPLQRLVSGYYEAVVYRQKVPKDDGSTMTFEEFLDGIASGRVGHNLHWNFYADQCQICDVDYDFIVKQETIDDDIVKFRSEFGIRQDLKVELMHLNKQMHNESDQIIKDEHNYKYDKLLADYQKKFPSNMRQVIKFYQYDMDLLGYHWNWNTTTSSCGISTNGSTCC